MRHGARAAESRPALHDRYRSATTPHAAGSGGFPSPPSASNRTRSTSVCIFMRPSKSDNCSYTRQLMATTRALRHYDGHSANRSVIHARVEAPTGHLAPNRKR
uniref:Uncharacterized protein n=1 Tax=Plectus sambesii TaxID=2011161 RepID=A0A914WEC5_9BILA